MIGKFESMVGDERSGMVKKECKLFLKNAPADPETGKERVEVIQRECDSPNPTEMRTMIDENDVDEYVEMLLSLT